MREKDFELWDICGRPGSLCVAIEDIVVNVSGDTSSAVFFKWITVAQSFLFKPASEGPYLVTSMLYFVQC